LLHIDGQQYLIDASKAPNPLPPHILGTPDLKDLTLKTYFRDIKAKLINYQQAYIPLQMYLKWCDEIGLTESHANDLLKALHFSGDILHFRDLPELKNFIFLKPQAVTDMLINELNITFATRNVPQLVEQLERILPEFIPLNEKKTVTRRKGSKIL